MTYGWALLIIVVVGAALYALGVLNPATYTQSTCRGFQYFIFQDQRLTTSQFDVVLLNGNSDVTVTAIDFNGVNLTISPQVVAAGSKFSLSGTGAPVPGKGVGDSYSNVVTLQYDTGDIVGKKDSATCMGSVQ